MRTFWGALLYNLLRKCYLQSQMPHDMGPRLLQSQTQKLILSPQMRQYLRLLQLPLAQLQATIEQEMAENPVLEEAPKEILEEPTPSRTTEDAAEVAKDTDELRFDETLRSLNQLDENFRSGVYDSEDLSLPEIREAGRHKDYRESLITQKETLFDYLLWQIGFLELSEGERKIAEEIVGNLSDDGYLTLSLEEIAQVCGSSIEEAEKVLRLVQSLDPAGVAARNLQEGLLLQLERKGPEADLAEQIIKNHLPLLEKKQWSQIAKQLTVSSEEVQQAAKIIAHLDPHPGRTFFDDEATAITPDATISRSDQDNSKLQIEIHDEELPEIRISPYYRRLLKNGKLDAASRRFLKEKIQSAIDFVKALNQRKSTLRRITEEIMAAQPGFFEKGFSELKPLRLKDISQNLNIHESTVSRALQGKYISTPQGTLPYKSFFSSKLETMEGGAESQKSMMEKIRALIRSENSQHPLSDQEITDILQKEGIKIARRTVAKYRELLKILPSHLRAQK